MRSTFFLDICIYLYIQFICRNKDKYMYWRPVNILRLCLGGEVGNSPPVHAKRSDTFSYD